MVSYKRPDISSELKKQDINNDYWINYFTCSYVDSIAFLKICMKLPKIGFITEFLKNITHVHLFLLYELLTLYGKPVDVSLSIIHDCFVLPCLSSNLQEKRLKSRHVAKVIQKELVVTSVAGKIWAALKPQGSYVLIRSCIFFHNILSEQY